jgi:hypothetical protein
MAAEFYLLDPGRYELTITAGDGGERELSGTREFVVESRSPGDSFRRTRVDFELPPHRLCVLRISPAD